MPVRRYDDRETALRRLASTLPAFIDLPQAFWCAAPAWSRAARRQPGCREAPRRRQEAVGANSGAHRQFLANSAARPFRARPRAGGARGRKASRLRSARRHRPRVEVLPAPAPRPSRLRRGTMRPRGNGDPLRAFDARFRAHQHPQRLGAAPKEARISMSWPLHQPAVGARSWVTVIATAEGRQLSGERKKPCASRSKRKTCIPAMPSPASRSRNPYGSVPRSSPMMMAR